MNEELTREVLEAMKKCDLDCALCSAIEACSKHDWQETMQALATALLEERAKPKVWNGAPNDAASAVVNWCRSGEIVGSVSYNRELPKTRARIIAEEIVRGINDEIYSDTKDIEYVEGVLKRYAEELKGEA